MRLAPPYSSLGAVLIAAALVAGGVTSASPAGAATRKPAPPVMGQTLRAPGPVAHPAASLRVAPRGRLTTPQTSTWTVHYDAGFQARPAARAAFQAAVDIWSRLVTSRVPISVDAVSTGLDPGVLGQAGPTGWVPLARDGLGGTARTYYPDALANALTRRDLSAGSDITAEFDTTATDVYYGTDGRSGGKYDFETVVLHELGHGLGLLGSMDVDADGHGFWGFPPRQPEPTVYDRFAVRSGGSVQRKPLLSYIKGSLALGSALTSSDVYWDGPHGKAAYNGRPPRLYVPRSWEPASSYSHLSAADFPPTDINSLMTAFVGQDEVKRDPGSVVLGMFADMGWVVPTQPGVRFSPVTPVRVLDSRTGTGGLVGPLGSGRVVDVPVVGSATGVPDDAAAVVLAVTGLRPASAASDLRVYPTPVSGTAEPLGSSLVTPAGGLRTNLVTVPVGDHGRVRMLNSGGSVDLLADVRGWYGGAATSTYHPTPVDRILDTRDGTGGAPAGPVQPGTPVDVKVTGGSRSVPDGATAVAITLTATDATADSDVRAYATPADTSPAPDVTDVVVQGGRRAANLSVVAVGAGGSIRLLTRGGSVNLVADLVGWYDGDPNGALFHVLAPQRVLDTRSQTSPRVGPGATRDVRVAGVGALPGTGVTGVTAELVGIDPSGATDVAAYATPNDDSVPVGSSLALDPHDTGAALVMTATGLGDEIRLRNGAADVALVVDVTGWFGP